jgi:cytoskeletal protein CcmA (bactofilin family)
MWNRKEARDEKSPARSADAAAQPYHAAGHETHHESRRTAMTQSVQQPALIGQSILFKGELTGNEDLTIDGTVEGKIDLKEHHLTIGKNGRIKADLRAKTITIIGEVVGQIVADDKVELQAASRLQGDIIATRLSIADGAHFKGSVDMERKVETVKPAVTHDEKLHARPPQRAPLPV